MVSASSPELSQSKVDAYLLSAGYSETLVGELHPDIKAALYRDQATFVSEEKVSGNLIERTVADNITPEEKEIANDILANANPIDIQSLSNFTHNFVVSRLYSSTDGLVRFSLTYNWQWDYSPIFNLTDKVSMAWTDDFDYEVGSGFHSYTAKHKATGTRYDNTNRTVDKYAPGTGIGFAFDIKAYVDSSHTANHHSGGMYVIVTKAHDNSGSIESSSAVAKYFHKQGAINGELQFTKTPSLSITYSTQYDESDDLPASWTWYKEDRDY